MRNAQIRFWQLFATSQRILRQQGLLRFVSQAVNWLRGKRGYHRTLKPAIPSYKQFLRRFESRSLCRANFSEASTLPELLVVTFVGSPDAVGLQHTARSLLRQNYPRLKWLLVTPGPIVLQIDRAQLPITQINDISEYEGLSDAAYLIFVDSGDSLSDQALCHIAQAAITYPEADYFYSDSDEFDEQGNRCNPLFKANWSPETTFSVLLLWHCGVSSVQLWRRLQPFTTLSEFTFRVKESAKQIRHLPYTLYHRRGLPPKVEREAVYRHLLRQGIQSPVLREELGHLRVEWEVVPQPKISIIIPSRDHAEILAPCLQSLFSKTTYQNFEVLLVDTGSIEPQTQRLYASYKEDLRFRVVPFSEVFNFGRACNWGSTSASGDILLFLNNDTEIIEPDWLQRMAQWFAIDGIGAIGPKLLYPNGIIQHAGIVVGMHGLADNLFALSEEHTNTPFGSDDWYRNYLAVTGACLMVPKRIFEAIGGFDEAYQLLFSDVELCVRIHEHGYRIVYTPAVRLLHHESVTHKRRLPPEDHELASARWQGFIQNGDPYFNPNLTHQWQIPSLRINAEDTPYLVNKRTMSSFRRLPLAPQKPPGKP